MSIALLLLPTETNRVLWFYCRSRKR